MVYGCDVEVSEFKSKIESAYIIEPQLDQFRQISA